MEEGGMLGYGGDEGGQDTKCELNFMKLTQSVVNGAPEAINTLTSSAWPLRDASSSRFPRSTRDIFSFAFMANLFCPASQLKEQDMRN